MTRPVILPLGVALLFFICVFPIAAQETVPKYEVSVQFSSLSFNDNQGRSPSGTVVTDFKDRTLPAIGVLFTLMSGHFS